MKKILFLIFILALVFPKSSYAAEIYPQTELDKQMTDVANSAIAGERIENFESNITVLEDGSLDIREVINYYFDSPHHGIYRYIPFTLQDSGQRYDMKFNFAKVTDENGNKYNSQIEKSGEQWYLKIGDPNKTISGFHTYVISYTVKGGLRYFNDHDELYWNVNGNGWEIPIKNLTTNVTLPSKIKEQDIKADCFTGSYGSEDKKCTGAIADGKVIVSNTQFLSPSQGLTVAVSFPKGIVAVLKPEKYIPFFERWYGKLTLLGIIIAGILWYLILPVYLVVKWFRHGRDPYVGIAVTATFDPPKIGKRELTPAETGALLDETVDKRDLFATIVDLARRGYILISEPKEKQFLLTKTVPKKASELMPFESRLLNGVFEDGEVIELKKVKFYETATKVEEMLYKRLVTNGFFVKNPKNTRSLYYALGSVSLITFNFVLAFIAFVFGRVMPAKTLDGAKTAKMGEGLKNFLKSQERQLNFQGDKQMLFERLLPYAVAFGVEKQWAKRFEGFDLKNPNWYEGTSATHFNAALFAASISHSYSNFAASSTPPSSSSSSGFGGGGFSGGGGGGGGGGSW